MLTPELLENVYYRLALRLAGIARDRGYDSRASLIEDMAQGGELVLALYVGMKFAADHGAPVPYDDYTILKDYFSHDDDPDWDPNIDAKATSDEAEVFKKLKLADE